MYTLTRNVGLRYLLVSEVPALATSLAISEVAYRFHSFTLECTAFLATWYLLSRLYSAAKSALSLR